MTNPITTVKKPLKKIITTIRFSTILIALIFAGSALLSHLHLAEQNQQPFLQTLLNKTDALLHETTPVQPQEDNSSIDVQAYACVAPSPANEPTTTEITGTIKRGETFDSSLKRQNISKDIRLSLIDALRTELNFKRIKPEDNYLLQLDDNGELASFSYESSPLDILTIKNSSDGYQVSKAPIELERKKIKVSGEISSSLFAAFSEKNEDMRLVYAFADIFSSKIDFNTEIQPGDRFSLVVDKYYKNGELVGYGKIDAAQYHRVKGSPLEAYLHVSSSGKDEYYDKNGLAAGTAFLRSPVPVGKLTSKFTYQRKHPISGRIKPHLGIDLSAPTGTPIMAVADGRVIDIGRKGGFGNQITLTHSGNYKTYYGHLSGFKKGLRKGSLVSKKDIIGYVGSTGISTGPHLDYRVQHHTVFQNPFGMTIKTEITLAGKELRNFKQTVHDINKMADFASFSTYPQILKVSNLTITKEHKITLL